MRYSGAIVGATLAAVANAHTTIWALYEDGVSLGVGNVAGGYIRYPPNNNPVKDITSKDMTCNVANTPATLTKTVTAGSKLSLEWHHESQAASDEIIAASHKGPVMVYIAPTASNGAGDVWVKIAEDGYDASTKKWAVDTLIANKGIHSFTLPAALADGDYLIRGEIIALHEADAAYSANPARGAQFYMECVQVTVTGGGSTVLPAGVAIPGVYSDADVTFNVYGAFTSYTIPGPALWSEAGGEAVAGSPVAASSTKAAVVASTAAPVVSSAPVTSAAAGPVVSSSKSACKAKTSSVAPVVAVVTSAPAASGTKSACTKKPTTLQTIVKPSSAASAPVATSAAAAPAAPVATGGAGSGTGAALYAQCGGIGFTGATTCASGTCTKSNDYYSQCI